jgi:predicted N-acetyltransferase YhbS
MNDGSSATTRIVHLFERPQHMPTVATWIYNEFWADKNRYSTEDLTSLLRQATRADVIPLSLLALCSDEPVGTVNLIENDDEHRSELTPWLAALYVRPEYRRRGIGSLLVYTLQQAAVRLGFRLMYLGTDNPAFYAHLGAGIHEQRSENFSIMFLQGAPCDPPQHSVE